MTTRAKISEQIQRLYIRSFDREDVAPKIDSREVELLVDQVANQLMAAEPLQLSRIGNFEIPTCIIGTYSAQEVKSSGGKYTTTLPCFPIKLPFDIGVFSVAGDATPAFIPIRSEFWDLIAAEDEGLLENQAGFYVEGKTIRYTKDPGVATVNIKLLVIDPSLIEAHDPYPISPEMEVKLIAMVLELLGSRGLSEDKPKG